ncbi:MAG: PD40 domain-containing protein [Bacteroidetes bacterium]|nr:PD40 domain-containing protein [Bacteroidota bacterium]
MILKTTFYKIVLLLFAMVLVLTDVNAQYSSQEELKKAAQTFFDEENYLEALPLYSQLLSLYPKDPDYNYKYGASYFYGNREKENALKYLRFAVSKPNVNPLAFYFLASALHHEYLFIEAELNYNKFREKGIAQDIEKFQVNRKIEMCRNGVTLIKSMTDIGVLVKKEIKATEFFRSYDLRGIGGKIIVKPDEFKTKIDLKKNETTIIHLGDQPTMVVFSSYGNDGKNGKDIFKVVKLPNGEWSNPSQFPKINTKFDEDYPFLHPDGKTLYFSSKGYNSMGGYDIFKSTLDQATGEWSFPENLDFPINTPDDDILFISDIDNELAYFASSRASKQGELTVYKVQVDRQPAENTIVKGFFIAESNPNMKSATITIMDAEKDKKYGVFSSNAANGNYVLVFPGNGGKFKILVETTNDAPVHSAVIELPSLEGFRALKQELRLVGQGDSEKLVVKNLFNESDEFDISDPLIVENLLKNKAKMDVNLTEEELNTNIDNTDLTEAPNLANLSNQQLVDNAKKSSGELADNAKLSRVQSNQAYDLAAQKSAEAKTVYNQYQENVNIAKESQDLNVKTSAFIEAEQLKLKAAKLANEAVASLNIAKTLESEAVERESDVKKSAELSTAIASKINAGNRSEAETNYSKLEEITNSTYNKESALTTEKTILDDKLSEKELEYSKIRNNTIELTNRETELVEQIDGLKDKINKTSKKPEKETLQAEVNALNIDLEDTKYDLGVAIEKETKIAKELKDLKNNYATSTDIIAAVSKTNAQTPTKTTDKTTLNNDILFFEKQGLVGLYPSEEPLIATNNIEKFDLKEHKDEFSIISEEGKIIDYSSKHSSRLVDAQQNTNEYQKSLEMAKINQDWIADINEEIAIKEKQLQVADNLNDKTKITSRIEVLKNLKTEKQKEAEEQLAVASTQSTVNNSQTLNTSEQTSPATITNAQGDIIDYSSNYENQLAVLDEKESTPSTIKEKVAVYEQWKNANEQELLLKKIELKSAEGEDKINLVNRIEEIENQLTSNKEYIALYNDKLTTEEQPIAVNESETTNEISPTNSNTIDYSKYDSKVVSANGEVLDYTTDYNNQITSADNIVDPLASKKEKEKVLTAWVNSINEEINLKNEQLGIANDTEKESIMERINSLNNEKAALNDQLSDIKLSSSQQESLMALKNSSSNNTTNPSTETDQNNTTNVTETVAVNAITTNIDGFEYSSGSAVAALEEANSLKENIIELNKQVEEKTTLAYASKNETEKEQLLNEASNLKAEQDAKQMELARVYEKTNKTEYYNNQEAISKVKQNANSENDNAILAELNTDEANTYFEKAQEERIKAQSSSTYAAQSSSFEKAEKLEKTAIEKQRKAIELYSSKPAAEVIASLPETNTTLNNNATSLDNNNSNTSTNANLVNNSSANTNNEIETNNNTSVSNTQIYQPSNVSMPSDVEKFEAKLAEQEATRLEKLAIVLQDSASRTSDDFEKEALITESNANKEKAVQLRKDAEISYAKADELTLQEKSTVEEINNNRLEISNEKFTAQDQTQINNLSSSEINEIKNSTDYLTYVNEKQESRRLVKEAEVDYIQADKFKEEADDQKTLGISLNAMAAGAQGAAKTKLLGQIEKLNTMILDNETKASERRTTATNKELTALEKTKKAENILASTDNANAIRAIEKAETFDNNFLAEAIANNINKTAPTNVNNQLELAVENDNTIEENTASNNNVNETTTETTQPELAVENNNIEENSTPEVIENPVITSENIETTTPEVVNENTTNTSNNESNTTVTQPTNNTTNMATVDEIPQVLTDQIFVFTPNKSAAYNENKRIPSSVKLPEGLVFKVQIGAFRNPIPQDHFRGFAPIMAEDAGNGITRYTAGLFKTFNMANEAKNAIRTIGYPDAFVVAFFNGKRININEARAMVGGTITDNSSQSTNNSQQQPQTSNFEPATSNKTIPAPKTNVELVEDGISTDVNKIKGVFFTVQVGVYSKPITAEQLNNVTPLNSERTANGLIRYTSGKYSTLNEANAAKDRIRTLGITDAFVIAYANGNRVGVNEAIDFMADKNNMASTSGNNSTSQPATSNQSINNTVPSNESKIVYTLILGEYSDEVPVEEAAVYLKLSNMGIKVEEKNGKTVYSMGPYSDFNAANDSRAKMKAEGVKNPKIVALGNDNVNVNNEVRPATNNITNTKLPDESSTINNNTVQPTENEMNTDVKPKINQVEVGKELNIEYKVLLGEYEDEVPVDDASVYLRLSGKGIKITENNGKTVYTIGSYPDYPSALDLQIEMKVEGIKSPKVIAFKDGTPIEVNEALELVKNYKE